MELDELTIECPICDKLIPATSKRCPFCGTELSMSGLDELEELAMNIGSMDYVEPPKAPEEAVDVGLPEVPEVIEGSGEDPVPDEAPVEAESKEDSLPDTDDMEGPDNKISSREERLALKAKKKEEKALSKKERREKKLKRKAEKRTSKESSPAEKDS